MIIGASASRDFPVSERSDDERSRVDRLTVPDRVIAELIAIRGYGLGPGTAIDRVAEDVGIRAGGLEWE